MSALILFPTLLSAQKSSCGDASNGAIIRGTIVDVAHTPVQSAMALLRELKCEALANRQGEFELKDVPAGSHKLTAAFIGFYRTESTMVVSARDTVTLVLRLVKAGDILRHNCPDWPICPQVPADSSLALAAFRTLTWFARGLPDFASRRQCVDVRDSANRVLAFALPQGVLDASACRTDRSGKSVTRASGQPAVAFWITFGSQTGDRAKVTLGARAEWRAGDMWWCDFHLGPEGWRASDCFTGDIEPLRWE